MRYLTYRDKMRSYFMVGDCVILVGEVGVT